MTLEGARLLELHSSVSVASGMSHHDTIVLFSCFLIDFLLHINESACTYVVPECCKKSVLSMCSFRKIQLKIYPFQKVHYEEPVGEGTTYSSMI